MYIGACVEAASAPSPTLKLFVPIDLQQIEKCRMFFLNKPGMANNNSQEM